MTDPLDRYFQTRDVGTAPPPPPIAEPPSAAGDALDSYFHRQDSANGNTVATQNIPPDAAAQAHRDQPQTGIPASMGMADPRVGRQIAAQRQAQEIFARSVGVSGFVGQSPVRAAAAADDLPVLERLSNYFSFDRPQAWLGFGEAPPPALAQLGHNVAEAYRQQQAAQRDIGYGNGIFNIPLAGSTASPRSLLAGTSLLTSPIWGPLDAAISQPFGITMQNNPTEGTPGSNPFFDLFVPGIGHRRRLTRTEAREYYAGLANILVNLVPIGGGASELRTPEGFFHRGGRIRPEPAPPGTPLLGDNRGTSAWHPYPVNSESVVLDTYGNPLSFSDARGAAMWLRQVNRNGEHGQVFEVFNEARPNEAPRYYLRETGRIPEPQAAPAPGVDPNVDTARQAQAASDAEALAEDTNQVKESALVRRSPELGAQFIDQQLPPGTNIYMPAQALALFYREQNLSVGPEDGLFGHILGFAQQLAQAVPINGDVVISRGQYLAAVANSPHADALHQIVRSNEAGLSTVEAQDVADHYANLPDEELGPLFEQSGINAPAPTLSRGILYHTSPNGLLGPITQVAGPDYPVVHDNTVVPGPDGNYEPITTWATRKYGPAFGQAVDTVGNTFAAIRDMIFERGAGQRDAPTSDYAGLEKQLVGTSFDPRYRGVHSYAASIEGARPRGGSFVNIGLSEATDPTEAAYGFIYTMLHELAHFRIAEHDITFPAELQRITYRLLARPDGAFQRLQEEFVNEIVNRHWPVIEGLREEFISGRAQRAGVGFGDGRPEPGADESAAGIPASSNLPRNERTGTGPEIGADGGEFGSGSVDASGGVDSEPAPTETVEASPQAAYEEQKQLLLEDLTAEERARAETIIDAIETAVDNTARAMFLGNLFKDAKSAGMTPRQWKIYSTRVERALVEANEKLIRRVVSQIKRERSPDWRERQEQNLAEVEQELNYRKDLVAYFSLRYSQSPLGAPLERLKLNRGLTRAAAGALADRLHTSMFGKDGLSPDDAALLLGYKSGQALLTDLVQIEDAITASGMRTGRDFFKNVARGLAAARTGEELGFDITPESIRSEASAAVNLKITDLLNEEMTILGKLAGLPIDLGDVQMRARQNFGQYTVRQGARLRSFELALARGGRKTEDALLKGDYIAAFKGKQEQLLAHHTLIEAHRFFRLLQRATRRIEGWGRQPRRSGMNQEYLDQMQILLFRLGFRVKRNLQELMRGRPESFEDFIARVSADGEVDDYVPELAPDQTWQDMRVEDFEKTYDLLSNLARVGRSFEQIVIDGREQSFRELKAEFLAGGAGIPNIPRNTLVGGRKSVPRKARDFINGLDAIFTKIEEMGDNLDNDNQLGVFNRFMINQAVRAADKRGELKRTIFEPISRAFYNIPKGTRFGYGNTLDTPLWDPRDLVVDKDTGAVTGGTKLQMLRGDLLSVMANMGTQSNIDAVARGYNVSIKDLEDFVHALATKEEWDFVQLVWDQYEKMFPELDAVHRKMRGYGVTKITAQRLVTPHGVYRGGYYPLRYDPILDPAVAGFGVPADPTDPMSILRARWGSMDPPTGMTKSRTNHKGAVYLQLEGPLVRGLDDLFTYIAYAEYIRDAKRFLLDPDVALYIRDKIGEGPYNEMMPWLAHQVADPILTSGEAAKLQAFFRQIRLNLQTAVMGGSWSTGISQILGNTVSAAEIGVEWQMVGIMKALKSYMTTGFAGVDKDIFENNEEMRQRVDEVERELRDVMKEVAPLRGGVTVYPRRAYRGYQRLMMHYIGMMDRYGVSVPTYYGAEAKALAEGHSPEVARQLAGKAVRVSQGTGRFMGMARVMRPGSELQKWLTIAYTYGSVQYNYMKRMIRNFGRGDMSTKEGRDRYQKAFGILLLVFFASTLMQAYLDPNQRPGGRNPNATPDWTQWVIDNIIFGGFLNTMPIVRDVGRGGQRYLESPRHDINAFADGVAGSNPFARLVDASAHAIQDDLNENPDPRAIRDHFTALGLTTGAAGSVPAGNAIEYLWDLHEGAVDSPQNIFDFFDGLTRGPPPRRSR